MNRQKILITDSLFIHKKHERIINKAGFDIERIDNPNLSEKDLCSAIKGKTGYILGGIEKVTERVIKSADKLKAISFTGSGYKEFITGYEAATDKGILISNCPGGNADAVAEYTLSLMLMMNREVLSLGRTGSKSFKTTKSIKNKTIGIIGLGRIGILVCKYLKSLGVKDILYYSRNRKFFLESGLGIEFVSKLDLMNRADIISLHFSNEVGEKFINKNDLQLMHKDAILINAAFPEAVDLKEMYKLLKDEKIFAAFDKAPDGKIPNFPANRFFYSNSQTGFNTQEAIDTVSNMTTQSIINLLLKKDDAFCINKGCEKE
ncbi:NAD(P)-dependent oxidoreductase [uncultured Winogradskyella sp.]|uniref:NAD(P)-dependent oxidoreductase n=1 Tax=uncultured Winogradskyella sp. TaxID=395353 RepID=UPI00262FDE7B|nr:NAD(P)-dependent oxidoreductase [uncultured Winogradskyella sp.]